MWGKMFKMFVIQTSLLWAVALESNFQSGKKEENC